MFDDAENALHIAQINVVMRGRSLLAETGAMDSPVELKAPDGLIDAAGWPIYTVSPRRERYHEFRKTRNPQLWGLDLWSPTHLRKG